MTVQDFVTNGRPISIQIGDGHSDTDVALRIRNSSNVMTACILGNGQIIADTFNIANVPTSSEGLSSGDIWSNSGVLTIVA